MIPPMKEPKAAGIDERGVRDDERHLVRELAHTHQALMAGLSWRIGMTASRFGLMRLLWIAERDVGVMELSRRLGVNAAAVTRQVHELESEGLVRRRADPKDRRRNYVRLSPKGRKAFRVVHDLSHEFERMLSSVIGDEEMAVATAVLAKLRTFLAGLSEEHARGESKSGA
jgi:DNA-binding MarR family transcriptional regulator